MLEKMAAKREMQELLTHPGWARFKDRVYKVLKPQLDSKLRAAARNGDGLKCAVHEAEISIIDTILEQAEKI